RPAIAGRINAFYRCGINNYDGRSVVRSFPRPLARARVFLERVHDIKELGPVVRLLDVALTAAAAVGDPGFGDLVVGDRVQLVDVGRPDDAGHLQLAHVVV